MSQFAVRHLEMHEISGALPLVRVIAPELDLAAWSEFAAWLTWSGGGIVGVTAEDRTLLGVAAYRPDQCLRHGRTLKVELAVTFELRHKAPARAALHATLEAIARRMGCESLVLAMAGRGYVDLHSPKAETWRALGLEPDSVSFAKRLKPTDADRPEIAAEPPGDQALRQAAG